MLPFESGWRWNVQGSRQYSTENQILTPIRRGHPIGSTLACKSANQIAHWAAKNALQKWPIMKTQHLFRQPFQSHNLYFKQSNNGDIVQDFGMFTNVKPAFRSTSDGKHRSPIWEETWRMEWEGSVELPCSFPHAPRQLSCCPLLYQAGRETWVDHLSGPAIVSGSLQPRRCEGERWQNEGRRCLSRRCPTQSCWLRPDAEKK